MQDKVYNLLITKLRRVLDIPPGEMGKREKRELILESIGILEAARIMEHKPWEDPNDDDMPGSCD